MESCLPRSPIVPADAAVLLTIIIDVIIEAADLIDKVSARISLFSLASVVCFHILLFPLSFAVLRHIRCRPFYTSLSFFSSHTLHVTLAMCPARSREPKPGNPFFLHHSHSSWPGLLHNRDGELRPKFPACLPSPWSRAEVIHCRRGGGSGLLPHSLSIHS